MKDSEIELESIDDKFDDNERLKINSNQEKHS